MYGLHKYPVVRLLVPFLAGIVTAVWFDNLPFKSFWVSVAFLFFLIFSVWVFRHLFRGTHRWLIGFCANLFLFTTAYQYTVLCRQNQWGQHFSKQPEYSFLIATVAEPIQEKEHSYKTVLNVQAVANGKKQSTATGRVIAYFAKDSLSKAPLLGSILCVCAKPKEVEAPKNPNMFNYKRYLAANNIYHQVYLQNGDWHLLQNPETFSIKRTANHLQQYFLKTLKNNGISGSEYAVVSALLLGYTDELDAETLRSYSAAGAVHILSVSGMHVGLVCFLLSFVLKFLDKNRRTRIVKVVTLILFIWFYAFLTGLSPSVMRAAAMFSFVSIGQLWSRKTELVNTLAVSALVLLLFNPFLLLNAGFELSYLAIVGIIFIYNWLYKLWKAPNRIVDWIWQLIAVSVAAQIATGPLAVYYFHQFPTCFLLTNLVAVPLSTLIIYLGVGLLFVSFIPFLGHFLGHILSYLLKGMNESIKFIESLPGSGIQNISWSAFETLVIYLALIFFFGWIFSKRKTFAFALLGSILCVVCSFTVRKIEHDQQSKIIFYSINKHSALELVSGNQSLFFADSLLLNDPKTIAFQTESEKIFLQIKKRFVSEFKIDSVTHDPFNNHFPFDHKNYFYQFENQRIVVLQKINTKTTSSKPLKVDYLVITRNLKFYPKELVQLFDAKLILIDASNSVSQCQKWQDALENLGCKYRNLRTEGALVCDLKK